MSAAILETLGFWFNEAAPGPYPRPQALVGGWDPDARAAVIAYLRAGRTLVTYPAPSHCRFGCEPRLGNEDHGDGTFVWPQGLVHYVAEHDVRLPERFIAHAIAGAAVAPDAPRAPLAPPAPGSYDDGPWLAWARAQGACLDLDGWEVPGAADRRKIQGALGFAADVVLARADTREVVLALTDGTLELRQLTPDGYPPRTLAGWDAWPRYLGASAST